jgi:hypothetical protein
VSRNSGDDEENVSLDDLLQSGNHPEELQGSKNQPIVSIMILPGLSKADSPESPESPETPETPETPRPRDRKHQRFNNREKEEFINLNGEEWHDFLQKMN